MDARTIVGLIVKTAGLVLLIYTLALAPDRIVRFLASGETSGASLFATVLFPLAVPLATGAFLFSFPAVSTNAVVGKGTSADLGSNLQVVVFSGIGLYFLLRGAITVAYYVALLFFYEDRYQTASLADPAAKASFASALFSVGIGAGLLVGARGLSGLLTRLRQ